MYFSLIYLGLIYYYFFVDMADSTPLKMALSHKNLDPQLLRDLETQENEIQKMIAMQPAIPLALLESKLVDLVGTIANIPPHCPGLTREWNNRTGELMNIYNELSSPASTSSTRISNGVPNMEANIGSFSTVGKNGGDRMNKNFDQPCRKVGSSFCALGQSDNYIEADSNQSNRIEEVVSSEMQQELPNVSFIPLPPSSSSVSLERELNSLESAINQIILNNPPLSMAELEARISDLITLVASIPPECFELSSQWSIKVDDIMQRYNDVNLQPQRQQLMENLPQLQQPDIQSQPNVTISHILPLDSTVAGNHATATIAPISNEAEDDPQLLVSLGQRIEVAFGKLSQARDLTDIGTLRKLLILIAKLKVIFEPLREASKALQMRCFTLALDKLPSLGQQQYSAQPGKKTLVTLAKYLVSVIKADAEQEESLLPTREPDEFSSLFSCQYCKKPGHKVDFCPIRMATFCFYCFQFGHSIKRCMSAPLSPEVIQL